jgi:nitric oxide reductase subunit B
MKRLWLEFSLVMILSFPVLGWIGTRIYQEIPSIPASVVTTDGVVLADEGESGPGLDCRLAASRCNDLRPSR